MHATGSTALRVLVLLLGASAAASAGDLQVTVLDGGLQRPGGVSGATLSLEDTAHTETTGIAGSASIASVASGRYVLRVAGPPGFDTLRLRVDVPDSGTVTLPPLLLPRLPADIAAVVTTSGGVVGATTHVESPLVPHARLTLSSGATIAGASGDTPALAIYPVERHLTPTPFPGEETAAHMPGELEPLRLYAVSPGGLGFSAADVRLPNDLGLPPGAQAQVFALLPRPAEAGPGWVRLGTATVDASADFLASDAAFVTSATLLAVHGGGALPTTYRLSVQDRQGNPLSGASVQVHRLLLTESTVTPGLYEGHDVLLPGAPVRALVSKAFGGGLELHALTDPVFVSGAVTELHGGHPLRLGLSAEGVATAGGVLRNAQPDSTTYLLTEGVIGAPADFGQLAGPPARETWTGPLPLTFFGPAAPVVEVLRSPAGTLLAPDVAPVLTFTVAATDVAFEPDAQPPYTTTARVTGASFSLDDGATWNPARLPAELGDARGPLAIPPGGGRYAYAWDLWSLPAPPGITGTAQEVRLRVSVERAPGGPETTVEAPSFHYEWPTAAVQRTRPQGGATGVWIDEQLLVDFAHAMNPATISGSTITLVEAGVGPITTATVTYLPASRQARITVAGELPALSELTLTVTTDVENAFGLALPAAHAVTFWTGALAALADDDQDGLLNVEELAYGTDPYTWDDWLPLVLAGTWPADPSSLGTPETPLPVEDAAPAATFLVTGIAPVGSAVALDALLSVTFNNPVDPNTVVPGTNLTLTHGGGGVSLTLLDQPNPRTLLLQPASLTGSTDYTFTVVSGGSGVKDLAGTPLGANAVVAFRTGTAAAAPFEPTHYLKTLAMTKWERFPLTAPTAAGRDGMAIVVPSTHKLLLVETDVTTPGRGLDVAITRIYRNNEAAATNPGCFGNHWFLPLERRFDVIASVDSDTTVDLRHRTEDGRVVDYLSGGASPPDFHNYVKPPGFYSNKKGVYDNLRQESVSGTAYLVQRERDGTKSYYRFYRGSSPVSPGSIQAGDVGYLVMIRDRNLNTITIARHAGSDADRPFRIDTITDDLGRVTVFNYSSTTGQKDLVVEVEQFQGDVLRSWQYEYDSNRSLVRVKTPPATWKDEAGNLVTNTRKQREYTYSASGGFYSLTSVTDGRGYASMRFFYDQNHDVIQVDHGVGADAGTAIYSFAVTAARTRAMQVDRNGNVLVLEHEDTRTVTTHATPVAFQNISVARQLTQGLHPGIAQHPQSTGEPAQYETGFLHDGHSALIQATLPSGDEYVVIRGGCGCPDQEIWRSGLDPFQSIVWEFKWDPAFKNLTALIDPRGSDHNVVAFGVTPVLEDVEAQTKRVLIEAIPAWRDAFTTFYYYDHEDVAARADSDRSFFGGSPLAPWFQDVSMPTSYGRDPMGGPLHSPDLSIVDPDDDGRADRGGNPVAVRGPRPVFLEHCALSSSRQVIERFASYNQFGQRAFSVDTGGAWHRAEFHQSGPMKGRLARVELDTNWRDTDTGFDVADGTADEGDPPALSDRLGLATTFEYDAFGNPTKVTNARGHTWETEFDQLNLPVRTIAPAPFLYERLMTYDGNNNLVELAVQNVIPDDRDDDGLQVDASEQRVDPAHPWFVHRNVFNTANRVLLEERDAWSGGPHWIQTRYQYDRKQLRIGVREPLGNAHWTRYDERDLVYETVLGASDPAACRTTRFDYTADGQLGRVVNLDVGTDAAMTIEYDPFRRPVRWADKLGNTVEVTLDRAGNPLQRTVKGQARSRTDAPSTWLENTVTRYDELGRPFQIARELFGVNSGAKLADLGLSRVTPVVSEDARRVDTSNGEMTYTLLAYDRRSNLVHECDDNAHRREYEYDPLNRLVLEEDHLLSTRAYVYDGASNVIRVTETDRRSDNGNVDRVTHTETFFDALNRPFAAVSPLGNTRRSLYDSRNNVVQVSDAMGQLSSLTIGHLPTVSEHVSLPQGSLAINARGNTSRFRYDGLSRLVRTERDLRQDGTGGSIPVGLIVTESVWDDNGRLVARVDPNGNATRYAHDHQNRQIVELFADGTMRRMTYHRVGTLATDLDARGTLRTYSYDLLERPTGMTVEGLPHGAGQTTFMAWDHDGLGRRTRAEDDDSIVELFFDSLSRTVKETQTIGTGAPRSSALQSLTPAVSRDLKRAHDGVGNLIKHTYPSGQTFERRYDAVDRLASVKGSWGGSEVAAFVHAGMGGRRLERDYTPSGGSSMRHEWRYDDERRVTSLESFLTSGGTRIRGFGYAWDRANNRRWERRLTGSLHDTTTGTGDAYRYDSAYRLVHDDQDVADASLDVIGHNVTHVPAAPFVASKASAYVLDAAGNRRQTTIAGLTVGYGLEQGAPTFDAAMNQYTVVGNAVRAHDRVGNLVSSSDSGRQAFYDVENRLVQWREGSKDVRYRYDALGRRIMKEDVGAASFVRTLYFYDGWQELEETDGSGTLTKRYLYGEGLDEVLRATLPDAADINGNSNTSELVDLWYHHNSLGSVVAVSDGSGSVKESYRYSAYGAPRIFDKNGQEVPTTQVQQPFMFTGRRWDFEEASGLYYYRLRYYEPAAGRFVSRDPLGLWGDPGQDGNGQNYCGNNPLNRRDPYGLDAGDIAMERAARAAEKARRADEATTERKREINQAALDVLKDPKVSSGIWDALDRTRPARGELNEHFGVITRKDGELRIHVFDKLDTVSSVIAGDEFRQVLRSVLEEGEEVIGSFHTHLMENDDLRDDDGNPIRAGWGPSPQDKMAARSVLNRDTVGGFHILVAEDGVWLLDPDKHIYDEDFERLLGVSPEDVLTPRDFCPPPPTVVPF